MNKPCETAKDRNGKTIRRGMNVLYIGHPSGEDFEIAPVPVRVTSICRQGADGTILNCDGPPKPEFPHHFSCRASDTVVQS